MLCQKVEIETQAKFNTKCVVVVLLLLIQLRDTNRSHSTRGKEVKKRSLPKMLSDFPKRFYPVLPLFRLHITGNISLAVL